MNNPKQEKILSAVRQLANWFQDGTIERLAKHEVHPGLETSSRSNYLYFTLVPSINFQRNSPALWQAAFDTYHDQETRYVFSPEEVVKRDIDELKQSLTKHRLALQTNKHTRIWSTISGTLNKDFANDPRNLLASAGNDVTKILEVVQTNKKGFPYLSGPKLSNYWLFILSKFTDVKLMNLGEISIIPDTHIIQSSVKLGLVPKQSDPLQVAQAWKRLLTGTELTPMEMHSVLWNWSRSGFKPMPV